MNHVGFLGPGVSDTPANFWVMSGHVGLNTGLNTSPPSCKKCDHVGFCSTIFNPDLRKIRSGLKNAAVFGSCRGMLGLCGTYVGSMLVHVGRWWFQTRPRSKPFLKGRGGQAIIITFFFFGGGAGDNH